MVILSTVLICVCFIGLSIEVWKAEENYSLLNSILSMFGLFVGLSLFSSKNREIKKEIKVEYQIELINQDSVRIKSLSTGKTYYESPENIWKALDKDNL